MNNKRLEVESCLNVPILKDPRLILVMTIFPPTFLMFCGGTVASWLVHLTLD